MIKFRTEIEREPLRQPLSCREGLLLLGSCFTDHIGEWLSECWLPVMSNPWGVLFNPASIASSLCRIINPCPNEPSFDLHLLDGRYYSFLHHGSHSDADSAALVRHLSELDAKVRHFWADTHHVFVTFGTAWVYERGGMVVANCHRFPASQFVRRRLTVEEIVSQWTEIIEDSGNRHFVFTVSPIRHIRDSLHGNQLSKATLHLAIEQLYLRFPTQVEYLPVYELLIDDLRDYRFYADDLVHPSSFAIQCVREFISEVAFDADLRHYVHAARPIVQALQHRPSNPESPEYKRFLHDTLLRKDALLAQFGLR